MKINGIDLSEFGAKLVRKVLESSDTTVYTVWPESALVPFIDPEVRYESKLLNISVEFKGNFEATEENKSRFLAALSICAITDYGSGVNILNGTVKSHSVEQLNNLYQVVNYKLDVIESKPEVSITITSTYKALNNIGTGVTPAKIEFTPSADGNYVIQINPNTETAQKFELNNCKSGVTREISTAGIFENGINVQKHTVFYKFPRLNSGLNKIYINPGTFSMIIRYSPRMV